LPHVSKCVNNVDLELAPDDLEHETEL
jgi:hypothetical protein